MNREDWCSWVRTYFKQTAEAEINSSILLQQAWINLSDPLLNILLLESLVDLIPLVMPPLTKCQSFPARKMESGANLGGAF
jgi:hypothetical protein